MFGSCYRQSSELPIVVHSVFLLPWKSSEWQADNFVFPTPTLYFLDWTIERNERSDRDDFQMALKTNKYFSDL